MRLRIANCFLLGPSQFIYIFAAFNGLAYYAMIRLVFDVLSFEKGAIRFVLNVVFLIAAFLIYVKNTKYFNPHNSKKWPYGVYCIIAYFIWSGISFFWGSSEGFHTQGYDSTLFYFAQWSNYIIELISVLFIFRLAPIKDLAMSYLKGLEMGGFILAFVYLVYWLFTSKTGRLAADYDTQAGVIHPTMLALKLSISFLCTLHLYFIRENKTVLDLLRVLIGGTIMLFITLMTIGKAAMIGLALATIFYILHSPLRFQQKLFWSSLFGLVALTAMPFISGYISHYIEHGDLQDLSGRTELWEKTWQGIQEKPWFGHGINSPFPTLWWNAKKLGHSGQAHNEYLNSLYQLGVVGVFIFLSIYLSLLFNAFKSLKYAKFRKHSSLCISLFIVIFVNSMAHSFPVGFCVPATFQVLLLLWLSKSWNAEELTNDGSLPDELAGFPKKRFNSPMSVKFPAMNP
jgi:O-antigen ligase